MDEYISREEVMNVIENMQEEHHYDAANLEDRYIVAYLLEVADKIKDFKAADVQPVDRWISVYDRLPESEKEVLVWYKYTWDAGFTSYGFGINVWNSNTKQWRDGCLLKGVEVLYWQLLPEPPKDGDTE